MQQLGLKYGFISNYDEIIFLRQVLVNGEWELQYNPIVRREAIGRPSTSSNQCLLCPSREGFFYMALIFGNDHEASNPNQWVISPTQPGYQTSTSISGNGVNGTNGAGTNGTS